MKKFLAIFLVFITVSIYAQEEDIDWRIIPSLTAWIEEINNWPDSIYEVEDIKILIDLEKDTLIASYNRDLRNEKIVNSKEIGITANKPVRVKRWRVETDWGTNDNIILKNIRFEEEVYLADMRGYGIVLKNVNFDKNVRIVDQNKSSWFSFIDCKFIKDITFLNFKVYSRILFNQCKLYGNIYTFQIPGAPLIRIQDCKIEGELSLAFEELKQLFIADSEIATLTLENTTVKTAVYISDTQFDNIEIEGAALPSSNTYIPFDQIKGKIGIRKYNSESKEFEYYRAEKKKDFGNKKDYDLLIASYNLLLNGYQNRGEQDSYNTCYSEMKDIETRRLAYLHAKDLSFTSYFSWKINQFLKIFSAYGTQPAKAIVFSMYVILFFAFIYLFFPNSWDSHGRRRIMDRFRFFTKYMNKEAGIHEVYLEENKTELLESKDFKNYMLKSEKSIPKFFINAAVPLYKWSVAGINLSASLLKRVDIMKGTWKDLPKSKRAWKTGLLIGGFSFAIIYDLFIKVLNALMLSINTFTTLGFGEIPIKGLPRYLAIIQGFIGWFMLTIFSVSLISQLLN